MLPANVDPQNVGDLSHAACKFETNGSTKIGLSIYRLACTNGVVTGTNGFSETLRQRDPMERLLQTTIKAEECVEAANSFLEYYSLLNATELDDIHSTIRQLCASNRIGVEIAEVIIDVWESLYADMGRTLYSVTQAFTHVTSHGYGSGDNHETLSDGQIRRIDNMLTATMVSNATETPHCNTCGAELA
jgi:hypothetical protein